MGKRMGIKERMGVEDANRAGIEDAGWGFEESWWLWWGL
jgi:hypothetical protein